MFYFFTLFSDFFFLLQIVLFSILTLSFFQTPTPWSPLFFSPTRSSWVCYGNVTWRPSTASSFNALFFEIHDLLRSHPLFTAVHRQVTSEECMSENVYTGLLIDNLSGYRIFGWKIFAFRFESQCSIDF